MKILFWGLFFFCFTFLVHLIVWRIRLPERQTKTLLCLFFGTLLIGLCILWSANWILPRSANVSLQLNTLVPNTLSECFQIALFVISLTLAYLITYSALEADSPSLVIIMSIARAGSDGLPKDQFEQCMTDDILIIPRVQDLLRDNLVYREGEKYKLTAKGIIFVRIFILYRQLLKTKHRGG